MGMFIPRDGGRYLFASPDGEVSGYSWASDDLDAKIFRTLGVWRPRETGVAQLQSRMLRAIQPLGAGHWSELNHKTFWEWVDDYELP